MPRSLEYSLEDVCKDVSDDGREASRERTTLTERMLSGVIKNHAKRCTGIAWFKDCHFLSFKEFKRNKNFCTQRELPKVYKQDAFAYLNDLVVI